METIGNLVSFLAALLTIIATVAHLSVVVKYWTKHAWFVGGIQVAMTVCLYSFWLDVSHGAKASVALLTIVFQLLSLLVWVVSGVYHKVEHEN